MNSFEDLYPDRCCKVDPFYVDAFVDASLNPLALATLVLDSSWGATYLDLTPAVKTAETITHLVLNDKALLFEREDYGRDNAPDNGIDCFTGAQISRILSMSLLGDVSQTQKPATGDVYMYNDFTGLFSPFALQNFVNTTNANVLDLQQRLATAEEEITILKNRS